MAAEIRMPQFGVSMETGTIAQWCKAEGDPVKVGDVLASIETEKLTNDVISEVDGVLLKIVAPEGTDVPVQGLMAYVGQPGEVLPGGTAAAPAAPAAGSAPAVQSAEAPQPSVGRIKASPLARKHPPHRLPRPPPLPRPLHPPLPRSWRTATRPRSSPACARSWRSACCSPTRRSRPSRRSPRST